MHTHSLSIHPDSGRALRPWELALLLAVCVTLLTGTWAQARSTLLASRLVRLHVIAVSDDDTEQAVKLQVRDAVLECVREMLGDCENAESAWSILNERLGEIESAARIAAEADGFSGEIRAETGVFPFPDRDYGGVFVPAGDYRAVRIVIGAGEGRNWWCVLYPTLCVPPESAKRSVIAEWIRAIFGLEESR